MQRISPKIAIVFLLLLQSLPGKTQFYTSFFTGDTTDISSNHQSGTVLAGGGQDNDDAMRWMLARAAGGDVVVIRVSGSDGYNDYFFSDLGVNVNSVETIKFNSFNAANDPYVNRRIREAEVLFIAGGNQSDYRDFWRNTAIAESINFLLETKGATVGGTSAGMAILGGIYYAPDNQSLISIEALNNPYHSNAEGISSLPFLRTPFLSEVITDTHFQERDREGRSFVFLARARALTGGAAYTISCNESTAVAIDDTGIARVFGDHPNFNEYAFFLQAGCFNQSGGPEIFTPGSPIRWDQDGRAVSVYRVPGTPNATNTFDLNNWTTGSGGTWQYWTADQGQLSINDMGDEPMNCAPLSQENPNINRVSVYPQPAQDLLMIDLPLDSDSQLRLFNANGQLMKEEVWTSAGLSLEGLAPGLYFLQLKGYVSYKKIIIH